MKESAIVGLVTIGLLVLLVGAVASGLEDSAIISMARHFPVSAGDLDHAVKLGHDYRLCQLDFIHRNRAQYAAASTLIDSSKAVCVQKLGSVSGFLASKGYVDEVVSREVKVIEADEDSATQKLVAVLYR